MPQLSIKPADPNGPWPKHGWDLWLGKEFVAYSQTRLGIEKAKKEIAKHLPAMPEKNSAKPLTPEEREAVDRTTFYEQINGVITIDRRNEGRPGEGERLICWRLNARERFEALRYGVVSRVIPVS